MLYIVKIIKAKKPVPRKSVLLARDGLTIRDTTLIPVMPSAE